MANTNTNNNDKATLADLIASACIGALAEPGVVECLRRLTTGANMETWSFEWRTDHGLTPMILRRVPGQNQAVPDVMGMYGQISIRQEAKIVDHLSKQGLPVAKVYLVLEPDNGLGQGYIMSRESGEALPHKLLGQEQYANAREILAFQCGAALAAIHSIPLNDLPVQLDTISQEHRIKRYEALLDKVGSTSVVLRLALNWLYENAPQQLQPSVVHGDFRMGNILVDGQGLVAVLDWELAHIGNPMEDLGYLCGNVWRFGKSNNPVGGFGQYDDLFSGYESIAGTRPSVEDLFYWEVHCAFTWGVCCELMQYLYRSGVDRSIERLSVGRRLSEAEIDLLLLLENKFSEEVER